MARTAININTLSVSVSNSITTGTVDPTNDMVIPATAKLARGALFISTAGTGGTLTVKAGDNSPAGRSGLGDYSIVLGTNIDRFIPVESARFSQSDGTIEIDIVDMNASTISFIQLADGL